MAGSVVIAFIGPIDYNILRYFLVLVGISCLAIGCLPSAMPNIQKSRMLVKRPFSSLDYLSAISYFYDRYLYLYLSIQFIAYLFLVLLRVCQS